MTPRRTHRTVAGFLPALALLLAVTACGDGASAGSSPYTPPQTTAGDDGWETYVEAPMIDATGARGLDPAPDSPEAAAVKFLASRVRGDGAWKGAMVDTPSRRAQRSLDQWDEWGLERFQLRGRKQADADTVWVKVFFEISYDGRSDRGEDEIELERQADGWRVTVPPA